tara:strand:+ start:181 stop:573 length:393 start_codon:yes stop_codon:yes gene_type:complete
MSQITQGRITLEHDARRYELQASLRAATNLNRQFGGFGAALERLKLLDLEALALVLAAGLNWKGSEALKEARELAFKIGALKLAGPLSDYLLILANGGRSLEESAAAPDMDEDDATAQAEKPGKGRRAAG